MFISFGPALEGERQTAITGLQHDKSELVELEDVSDETMTMVPNELREKDMAYLFHNDDTYVSPAF